MKKDNRHLKRNIIRECIHRLFLDGLHPRYIYISKEFTAKDWKMKIYDTKCILTFKL